MSESPAVSVIVATYRGAFLRETLLSILGQTYSDFEVLVLDDANESQCRRVVESMSDKRIVYVANSSPLRPALNHAKGIQLARGRYITVLNHDDLWAPDVLQKLTAILEREPTVVAAFGRARVANEKGEFDAVRTAEAWRTWRCADYPTGLIDSWAIIPNTRPVIAAGPATLVRAETLKPIVIPPVVGGMYDVWIGYQVARSGPVYHEDSAIGLWREHGDNLTQRRSAKRSFEPIYFDYKLAMDPALPNFHRVAAARRLPRSVASWAKDLAQGESKVERVSTP